MESKIRHIVVGVTPYGIIAEPEKGSITYDMLSDELVEKLDAHPVGSVYISYEPTSPAELFGGTWLEMTGVFPYFNHGTETGGSNTHTLTIDEMPEHNHPIRMSGTGGSSSGATAGTNANPNGNDFYIRNSGGNQPHNNMPAYQSFYAWRRTE